MEKNRNIRLTVEYDGTAYVGWQIQPNGPSAQAALRKAISKCLGENPVVYGASRTDSGVHARGQTANFRTKSQMPVRKMIPAINAHLPEDIAVVQASEAPDSFHSQHSAKKKLYRYFVYQGQGRPAVNRSFCTVHKARLDAAIMKKAARHLVGRHDFRAFGTEVPEDKNSVKTIFSFKVKAERDYIIFEVTGNGFLYNMVRTMVGTLLMVGTGKMAPEWVRSVLESRDRRKAGQTAPAKGLFLEKVFY